MESSAAQLSRSQLKLRFAIRCLAIWAPFLIFFITSALHQFEFFGGLIAMGITPSIFKWIGWPTSSSPLSLSYKSALKFAIVMGVFIIVLFGVGFAVLATENKLLLAISELAGGGLLYAMLVWQVWRDIDLAD